MINKLEEAVETIYDATCPLYFDEYTIISKASRALAIIEKKPYESADAINYIKINIHYPKMLDFEHYRAAIKYILDQLEFKLLMEVFGNNENEEAGNK